MSKPSRIGLIGLDAMGGACFIKLDKAGDEVLGYNPYPAACQLAASAGVATR